MKLVERSQSQMNDRGYYFYLWCDDDYRLNFASIARHEVAVDEIVDAVGCWSAQRLVCCDWAHGMLHEVYCYSYQIKLAENGR